MAKIMIDCADPNDFQEIIKAAEQVAGSCIATYANQHLEMREKGISKNISESARIIAAESEETLEAARHKIRKGLKDVGLVGQRQHGAHMTNTQNNNLAEETYKQHLSLIESGKSKSQAESARIIAAENGENAGTVRDRICRGKKKSNKGGKRKSDGRLISQKKAWAKAARLIKKLVQHLQRECDTGFKDMDKKVRADFKNDFDLLELYNNNL